MKAAHAGVPVRRVHETHAVRSDSSLSAATKNLESAHVHKPTWSSTYAPSTIIHEPNVVDVVDVDADDEVVVVVVVAGEVEAPGIDMSRLIETGMA